MNRHPIIEFKQIPYTNRANISSIIDEYNEDELLITNKAKAKSMYKLKKSSEINERKCKSMHQKQLSDLKHHKFPKIMTEYHQKTIKEPISILKTKKVIEKTVQKDIYHISQFKKTVLDDQSIEYLSSSNFQKKLYSLKDTENNNEKCYIEEKDIISILNEFRSHDQNYCISSSLSLSGKSENLPINNNQFTILSDKAWHSTNLHINSSNKRNNKIKDEAGLKRLRKTNSFISFLRKTNVKTKTIIERFKRASYLFSPNANYKVSWDVLCMLLIIYEMIYIPFSLSFDISGYAHMDEIDFTTTIIFSLDILITFNTGYFDHGILIMKRKKILKEYLKFWFWIDLISTFPYNWIEFIPFSEKSLDDNQGNNKSTNLLRFLRIFRFFRTIKLLRVFKLKRMLNKIETYLDMSTIMTIIIGFLKLGLTILIVAHWIACLWHYIGYNQIEKYGVSWITMRDIKNENWEIRYITSIYWATTTMVAIGYGDIVPQTIDEKLFAMVVMIIACCTFAYVMNKMQELLLKLESNTIACKNKISRVTAYLNHKKVTLELKARIKQFIEFMLTYNIEYNTDNSKLLSILSENLRNELIKEVYHKITMKARVIAENFSEDVVNSLCFFMQEKNYTIDDIIFEENGENENDNDKSLYIIKTGAVLIYSSTTNTSLKILEKGTFGEIAFFTGMKRTASARAQEFSTILSIKRSDFIKIIQNFPEDHEKFNMIRDNINLKGNYGPINLLCYSCHRRGHTIINCPTLHYQPDKTEIINKYQNKISEIKQKMSAICSNYKRTYRPKTHNFWSYGHLKTICETLLKSDAIKEKIMATTSNLGLAKNSLILKQKKSFGYNKLTMSISPKKSTNFQLKDLSSNEGEIADNEGDNIDRDEYTTNNNEDKLRFQAMIQMMNNRARFDLEVCLKELEIAKKTHNLINDYCQIQSFSVYFPHNNFEIIIADYQAARIFARLNTNFNNEVENTSNRENNRSDIAIDYNLEKPEQAEMMIKPNIHEKNFKEFKQHCSTADQYDKENYLTTEYDETNK